jgi:5'-3' exonuclease
MKDTMIEQPEFDLVIIDLDSILYQIAFVEPSQAKRYKQLQNKINEIMQNTGTHQSVCVIKGKDNFRYQVAEDYKGNRKDNLEPDIKERLTDLYNHSKDFSMEADGMEADDLCHILSKTAAENTIIAHMDKDLNAISGWHYNFKKLNTYKVTPEEGYLFLMKQILTGDSSDNIKGLFRVGPVAANNLLDGVPQKDIWNKVIDTYKTKSDINHLVKCANLIYIREYEEHCKPLTLEELTEVFNWKNYTDTGIPSQTDQKEPLDLSTTSKTLKQEDDTLEESN